MILLAPSPQLSLPVCPNPSPAQLAEAKLVIFPQPDWERLRGWRLGGNRFVAVVCAEEAPEGGRALMEPLVVVPVLDASVLQRGEEIGENLGKILLDHAEVDLMRGTVKDAQGNVTARLSTLEQDLLSFLAARSQREVNREELQLQVWGHKRALPTRSVDMAISRLRKKNRGRPWKSHRTTDATRRLSAGHRHPTTRARCTDCAAHSLFFRSTGPPI